MLMSFDFIIISYNDYKFALRLKKSNKAIALQFTELIARKYCTR